MAGKNGQEIIDSALTAEQDANSKGKRERANTLERRNSEQKEDKKTNREEGGAKQKTEEQRLDESLEFGEFSALHEVLDEISSGYNRDLEGDNLKKYQKLLRQYYKDTEINKIRLLQLKVKGNEYTQRKIKEEIKKEIEKQILKKNEKLKQPDKNPEKIWIGNEEFSQILEDIFLECEEKNPNEKKTSPEWLYIRDMLNLFNEGFIGGGNPVYNKLEKDINEERERIGRYDLITIKKIIEVCVRNIINEGLKEIKIPEKPETPDKNPKGFIKTNEAYKDLKTEIYKSLEEIATWYEQCLSKTDKKLQDRKDFLSNFFENLCEKDTPNEQFKSYEEEIKNKMGTYYDKKLFKNLIIKIIERELKKEKSPTPTPEKIKETAKGINSLPEITQVEEEKKEEEKFLINEETILKIEKALVEEYKVYLKNEEFLQEKFQEDLVTIENFLANMVIFLNDKKVPYIGFEGSFNDHIGPLENYKDIESLKEAIKKMIKKQHNIPHNIPLKNINTKEIPGELIIKTIEITETKEQLLERYKKLEQRKNALLVLLEQRQAEREKSSPETARESFYAQIYKMSDEGLSIDEIAQRANTGKGEVRLILGLRKK